eukprot:jgi/Bigna1/131047/aug1.13_g5755
MCCITALTPEFFHNQPANPLVRDSAPTPPFSAASAPYSYDKLEESIPNMPPKIERTSVRKERGSLEARLHNEEQEKDTEWVTPDSPDTGVPGWYRVGTYTYKGGKVPEIPEAHREEMMRRQMQRRAMLGKPEKKEEREEDKEALITRHHLNPILPGPPPPPPPKLRERVIRGVQTSRRLLENAADVAGGAKFAAVGGVAVVLGKLLIQKLDEKLGWSKKTIEIMQKQMRNKTALPDMYGDAMKGVWVYAKANDFGPVGNVPKYIWKRVSGRPDTYEVVEPLEQNALSNTHEGGKIATAKPTFLNTPPSHTHSRWEQQLHKVRDYAKVRLMTGKEVVVHKSRISAAGTELEALKAAWEGDLETIKVIYTNRGPKGCGPLFVAGTLDRTKVIEALLQGGADQDQDPQLADRIRPYEQTIRDMKKVDKNASDEDVKKEFNARLKDIGAQKMGAAEDGSDGDENNQNIDKEELERQHLNRQLDHPLPGKHQSVEEYNAELFASTKKLVVSRRKPKDLHKMGVCHYRGIGTPRFAQAAELGEAESMYSLGILYLEDFQDQEEATRWFGKAAEKGSPAGQYNLGVCYRKGVGMKKDTAEAVRWFERAVDNGHTNASFSLECDNDMFPPAHVCGMLCNRKAAHYMKIAADGGVPKASLMLGMILAETGTKKAAYEAFVAAAEEGDQQAMMMAAVWQLKHMKRNDPSRNVSIALQWLTKAADQGHEDSTILLGDIYFRGEYGVEKDAQMAVRWYEEGAERGSKICQYYYGFALLDGTGVRRNSEGGKKWILKSAQQNYRPAILKMQTIQREEMRAEGDSDGD